MQRETKIVLAAVIGVISVCLIVLAFWLESEPYRPQWDLTTTTRSDR